MNAVANMFVQSERNGPMQQTVCCVCFCTCIKLHAVGSYRCILFSPRVMNIEASFNTLQCSDWTHHSSSSYEILILFFVDVLFYLIVQCCCLLEIQCSDKILLRLVIVRSIEGYLSLCNIELGLSLSLVILFGELRVLFSF